MNPRLSRWLVAAGVFALAALGLPWSSATTGVAAPSRVAVVLGTALVVAGLTGGRDRLLPVAVGVGTVGVLIYGLAPTPGRIALAAAVGCLVAGLRADGRPVLPGRRRPSH